MREAVSTVGILLLSAWPSFRDDLPLVEPILRLRM